MLSSSCLVLLAYTLLSSAVLCISEPLSAGPNLVPVRRNLGIQTRDLWTRRIHPKSQAQLHYGICEFAVMITVVAGPHTCLQIQAEAHPASAFVTFTAHDARPILVMEDLDYLFDNVFCATLPGTDVETMMKVTFSSEDTFLEALDAWTAFRTFTIVTSHPTCNRDYERGAWRYVRFSFQVYPT